MKKLSILLIVLLVAAAFVSAQEFAPEVTVSGSATATFGIDLNDPVTTGFENTATANIELKLVPSDTVSTGEVGYISLSGFAVTLKSTDEVVVTAPSVTAVLRFDPVAVKLYSAPSLAAGNAAGFTWHADDDPANYVKPALANKNVKTPAVAAELDGWDLVVVEYDPAEDTLADVTPEDGVLISEDQTDPENFVAFFAVPVMEGAEDAVMTTYYGLTFTVAIDPITVDFMVASDGTWENSYNDYAIGTKVTAAIDPVSVNAGVFVGPFDAMDIGFTVGLSGAFGPVTAALGFDGWVAEDAPGVDWDASASIGANLGVVTLSSLTYLWWTVDTPDIDLNQQVVLDASGAVPGLGFTNTTQMINLLTADEIPWYNKTAVSYALDGGIKPFGEFTVDSEEVMGLTLGVELSELVDNTLFTAKYVSEELGEDVGLITFSATISY